MSVSEQKEQNDSTILTEGQIKTKWILPYVLHVGYEGEGDGDFADSGHITLCMRYKATPANPRIATSTKSVLIHLYLGAGKSGTVFLKLYFSSLSFKSASCDTVCYRSNNKQVHFQVQTLIKILC